MSEQRPVLDLSPGAFAEAVDREWFDGGTGRWIRLREALPGEFPPATIPTLGKSRFVVVRREGPAMTKRDFFAAGKPPEDIASLAAIFDMVDSAHRQGVNGNIPARDVGLAQQNIHQINRRFARLERKLVGARRPR